MTETHFHRRHDDPSPFPPDPEFDPRWQQEVADTDEESKSSAPLKLLRWLVMLALLALAVHLIIPQLGSLHESAKVLRTMRPWAVGLAILS
ncbi:MAG: hypothetical protein JO306_08970, partial [Gemmatimonadetes bacterium]|nr:hypothetical protein [Gemmatimonadota bacterium]